MGEGFLRLAFEQIHEGDRGLLLSAGWTVGLKPVPVFMTDRKLLGELLSQFELGRWGCFGSGGFE